MGFVSFNNIFYKRGTLIIHSLTSSLQHIIYDWDEMHVSLTIFGVCLL